MNACKELSTKSGRIDRKQEVEVAVYLLIKSLSQHLLFA